MLRVTHCICPSPSMIVKAIRRFPAPEMIVMLLCPVLFAEATRIKLSQFHLELHGIPREFQASNRFEPVPQTAAVTIPR